MDKLIWIYLFTNCCIAGTWEFNPKRAEFDLGKKINWESVKEKFSEKLLFTEKYWIIKNFIKRQYPNIAKKPTAPLHIAVLSEIEKKCLNFDLNSLSIVYEYTIDSVQVKEKVKVIVKEEVKVEEIQDESEKQFDVFRKKYPGSKRGNRTEYENFCKKHRDHSIVLPLLLPSLNNQSAWRVEMRSAGQFVPEWKNLQTWINQRCWEMEKPLIESKKPAFETTEQVLDRLEREGKIPRSPQ